jgi:hypothetical protein
MHKRDLTRFVKWPKYVRIQRQKRIILQRLKVPPMINQFSYTLDKNQCKNRYIYPFSQLALQALQQILTRDQEGEV